MNEATLRARYATFVLAAAIGTLFSIVVALLLIVNLLHSVPDPLTTPGYVALKEQLRADPDSEALKASIRDLDLSLRDDYFRRRQFTLHGSYLLLGGMVIAVGAAKAAARLHRRLPRPAAQNGWDDPAAQLARQALWGVAGLAALCVVAAVGLRLSHRSLLTGDLPQLAAATLSAAPRPDTAATPPAPHSLPAPAATTARPAPNPLPDLTAEAEPSAVVPAKPAAGPHVAVEPKAGSETKAASEANVAVEPKTAPPVTASGAATTADALQNWPRFRGPLGSGVAASGEMPLRWDGQSGAGVAWKSPVPLPGNSSPILWGDSVIVTGGDEQQREVYCFAAASGELRWKWSGPPNAADEPLEISDDTGYAACTAATDGTLIFAMFTNGDLAALDFAGKQVWCKRLGTPKNTYGHATSLAIAGGKLLLQFDQGGRNDKLSKLIALNPQSGETVWEAPREVPNSWSTPLVLEHGGQSQIITCADPWVIAYGLDDGKEIWRAKSLRQDVGPSPVAAGGLVYVANEFPGISAIRLGGQGDITDTHVAWFADIGAPDTCSPLVADGLLLVLASYGTLSCYDALEGGDPLWEEDFEENFRSSPSLAGGHVYLFSESGKSWVVRAGRDKCERVSENDLGEMCVTSPAFGQQQMFIRGETHLFCLKKEEKAH